MRIFSCHPFEIESSSFFFLSLFLTKYILNFYFSALGVSPRASAIMLSQLILNFSIGVISSDGDGVCFSFRQDLSKL